MSRREHGSGGDAGNVSFGPTRRPYRFAQQNDAERPAYPGDIASTPQSPSTRSAVLGLGWLQEYQRLSRTLHWRQTPPINISTIIGMRSQIGHRKPSGWR